MHLHFAEFLNLIDLFDSLPTAIFEMVQSIYELSVAHIFTNTQISFQQRIRNVAKR